MGNYEKQCRSIRAAVKRLGGGGVEKQTLSVAEVAKRLGTSERHVRRLVASRKLRWVVLDREKRIPAYQLDELKG